MPQPRLFSIMDKACYDFKMIEKGDKILVGASGGKDSTALIEYLANRKKRKDAGFDFVCVFVKTEFGKGYIFNKEKITEQFNAFNFIIYNIYEK